MVMSHDFKQLVLNHDLHALLVEPIGSAVCVENTQILWRLYNRGWGNISNKIVPLLH